MGCGGLLSHLHLITYNGKHDKILIKQTRFVLPPDPCIIYLSVQNEQSCGN